MREVANRRIANGHAEHAWPREDRMEPFDPAAQADKFEQAIRDRLAQCDWRNPAERQAVYDGISASVGERVVRLRSSGKTESADVVERALTQAIEQVEWQVARGSDRADGGVHVQAQTREAEAGRPGAHATPATRGRRQAAVRKGWTTAALAAGLVLVLGLQAWQMFKAKAMARLGYPPAGCGQSRPSASIPAGSRSATRHPRPFFIATISAACRGP